MTERFNRYGIYEVDHSTFGGVIFPSDYNTDYRGKNNTHGSPIAKRIADDKKNDEQYKKNIINKQNNRRK